MGQPLSLPVIQKYSCHSCGNCCRQHEILVTEEERQRILGQNWTEADGVPAGMKAFVRVGGLFSKRYRLANREDGACVFLDKNNRCRIHGKFGEAAKPLPCRIYPFAFHPAGEKIAVSLRFSCPSVAGNDGKPIEQHRQDLQVLRDLVVPPSVAEYPPPAISRGQQLDWPDTLRIVQGLKGIVTEPAEAPFAARLVIALFVAQMLGKATFDKVRGGRIGELIDTLAVAAPDETGLATGSIDDPTTLGYTQFRLITAQYATRDTTAASGLRYRLRKLQHGLEFTQGKGLTPEMHPSLPPVAYADLEKPFATADPGIDELFTRYFAVKLEGMAFCGPAFYGLPVIEGFMRLALIYPITMYIARWIACADGRFTVTGKDAQKALTIVDHHHGYSPAMGMRNFRKRAQWLIAHDEISRLAMHYAAGTDGQGEVE